MSEVEYGVIHRSDTEPHREHMTEATARAWIAEFEEDGGKAGAFRVIRRTIGPWELVDESSAGGAGSASPGPTPTTGASGVAPSGAPSKPDLEQHAGYFCATHGFVLIDFCSCPDDDVVSLWTNERDDDRFVQVLNRHRESSAKGAGNGG